MEVILTKYHVIAKITIIVITHCYDLSNSSRNKLRPINKKHTRNLHLLFQKWLLLVPATNLYVSLSFHNKLVRCLIKRTKKMKTQQTQNKRNFHFRQAISNIRIKERGPCGWQNTWQPQIEESCTNGNDDTFHYSATSYPRVVHLRNIMFLPWNISLCVLLSLYMRNPQWGTGRVVWMMFQFCQKNR